MYRCSLMTNPLQVPRPLGFVTDVLFLLSIKIKTVAFLTRSTVSLLREEAKIDPAKKHDKIKIKICFTINLLSSLKLKIIKVYS